MRSSVTPARFRDHGVLVAGSVEVGVDFPQPGELEPFAQLGDGKGAERDRVLVCLDPVAVLEDEHDVGDVLVLQATGYLPGVEA